MKIKKILGYIAVGAVCVGTGYLIGNAGAREKVCGGIKTIGGKLVATVKGKKSESNCEGNDCGDSKPQENERPQQENRQNQNNNNGGWRNKPRYNNNKNNNN